MTAAQIPTTVYHITFLRHGESLGNARGIYQGQAEFDLSETGIRQAQAVAGYWKHTGVCFDRVISSPLKRASQTAAIIASELGVQLELDPNWMERNNGRMAGLPAEEADRLYPHTNFVHPFVPIGETGESQWDLFVRASRAVHDIIRRPPGRYLVVSHGGILNLALYMILGIAPTPVTTGPRFRFRNTAFASLTYTPVENAWRMLSLNERPHWQEHENGVIQGGEPLSTGKS